MSSGPREGVHEKAALGFTRSVDAYDRGRPDYSESAIRYILGLLSDDSQRIVDLGAGTGKFTRFLVEATHTNSEIEIIAIEPLDAMRAKLREKLPAVQAVSGTAERLPVESASVDLLTVAQAYHWFDSEKAILEIERVLRPGGRLVLIWNLRDEHRPDAQWVGELSKILDRHESGVPRYKSMKWREAIDRQTKLKPTDYRSFPYVHGGGIDVMQDRVASISFIASLDDNMRATVLSEAREIFLGALESDGMVRMPYLTHVYVFTKT